MPLSFLPSPASLPSYFWKQPSISSLPWFLLRNGAVIASQQFGLSGGNYTEWGVGKKRTRRLFWGSLLDSRRISVLALAERAPSHTSLPCKSSGCSKGNFNIFSPKHHFLLKKEKKSPSCKPTAEHTACRATWKFEFLAAWMAQPKPLELRLRVYKPRFVGLSGWEEIS